MGRCWSLGSFCQAGQQAISTDLLIRPTFDIIGDLEGEEGRSNHGGDVGDEEKDETA